MEKEFVMGIDSGTQSVRAIVYDRQGNELALAQAPHEPYFSQQPGWAEQRPADFWEKFCRVTNEVMSGGRFDPEKLAAVGITTQRNGVFPVDEAGTPLRDYIIWLDQRYTEPLPPAPAAARLLFAALGKSSLLGIIQRNSRFTWIRAHEPEIYKRAHKFAQVSTWFVKKLTGRFRDSASMFVGYWPLEAKKFKWFGIQAVMEVFGITPEQLPELYLPDEVLGEVTTAAAQETGLPAGLPVVVGAGDKQSESLGAGGITPDIGVISFGTACTMEILSRKYVEDGRGRFFTWCSPIPWAWNLESIIFRGFWMARWFTEEMGQRESLEAEKRGVAPETVLDEVIRDIPPGSMGLMLHPHWTPHPSLRYSKGSITGFASFHTRAHIYRAIMEGLAFELRRLGEIVQKKTKTPLREIRVGGGGSRSDVAVQVAADIFNLPAKRMRTYETCALGAAINAAVATGMFNTFEAAVEAMVAAGEVFQPQGESARVYDELYRDVYLKTYLKLAPLYKRGSEITGYKEN